VRTRKIGRVRLCTLQPIALQVIECWVNARSARQEKPDEPEPPASKE
jgi:hypothetical protein